MNRLNQIFVIFILLTFGFVSFCGATNPAPTPQLMVSGSNTNANLVIDPSRPPVATAVIEGVSPGTTTLHQLTQLWGDPGLETVAEDGHVIRLYSIEPLNRIEVTLRGGIVRSIVIRLDSPFPEEEVRTVLQSELLRSKPVLIPNESGDIDGEVFPEKGVMFLFDSQRTAHGGFLVREIGIEPVSAEPFVMRAEAVLYDQPTDARQDLEDAIRLKPDHAKAFWLLAQIEIMGGHVESALLYNEKAIQLDEQRPAYHLTFVQALIRMNRIDEAKQYLQETIRICDRYPHEMARALVMLGDLHRTSRQPDHELAYACHHRALELSTALFHHSHPTIRLTARDVLFETHLATAKAIAWGDWHGKEAAIKKWLDRARDLARDPELLAARRYSREYPFKIASTTLTTLAAAPDKLNIESYIEDVIDAGNDLIQSTQDPILRTKYFWDTGIAIYDAVQIFLLQGQWSSALKYGELAADYMKMGIRGRNSDADLYLLGRLYFRLGAIHAAGNGNHRAAIEWFDLAKPIIERLLPKIDSDALGLFGDMLVSMGVSYWETDRRDEALQLTERGREQIERGVRANTLPASSLFIPFGNLAKMHRALGNQEQDLKYSRLAESHNPDRGKMR